ncbi:MAG: alpha/beta fold hydrolase [Acetobacteraceae bacterium]|nr:alpha/beta fold hydrolase [Acetobacteraceae bacterium]
MQETIAGVRIDRRGDGAPIWLFHSLLADAGSCAPLAERLAGDFTVFLPDLPGFGGSAACGPALADVADRMAQAISAASGPATVFGNGYGGFVALTLALRHPALVTRLVLAGTAATFPEAGAAQFRGMQAGARNRGLAGIVDVAMLRLFPAEVQASLPEIMAERRARFLATDVDVFAGACAELAGLDLRSAAPSLAMPALLMAGDGDQATPPALAEELAGLMPEARFKLLEGCAHLPQLQDPDRIAGEIRAFVSSHG